MAFPDRRTVDVLLTILLFSMALVIAYIARTVIVIFCFAILFAYLIDPVVRFLQNHSLLFKNLRGPHIAEAYLALLLVLGLIVYALAPGSFSRTAATVQQIPVVAERLSTGEFASDLGSKYGWSDTQTAHAKTFLVQHHSVIQNGAASLRRFAVAAVGALFLIPILAIFFLSDGENLANQAIQLISTKENLPFMRSLADDLHTMLRHYIRAKVILGGLSFGYVTAASLVLGFPRALTLGALAGVLEFIPMAGWMMATATIVTLGFVTHSHWIWMLLLLGIWRLLIDYWIAPRVLGHELELHPLLAIFTLMVGGAVGGLAGAYLSLPIAAAVRVIWRRLAHKKQLAAGSEVIADMKGAHYARSNG
jgi:predicted PurR-regulated permease PerM